MSDFRPLTSGYQSLVTSAATSPRHSTDSPTAHPASAAINSNDPQPASELSTINSNEHQPILDFISSDDTLDRYGEIIDASGWRLENYRRNPVFQNAHQYGDVIFTLGRALLTEVRGGKLFQRIEFATDINPMAKIAYGLYKRKFLNAVSVGF